MPRPNRRDFLRQATLGSAGAALAASSLPSLASGSRADPLNVAFVGVGNRGGGNIDGFPNENHVAYCDIDARYLDAAVANLVEKRGKPKPNTYADFREMLDKEKSLDVVVVSTPDHTHAVAAMMALKLGKHVYCEKPLTHSIYEARKLREVAAEKKLVTSMGNQGTAVDGFRTAVEVLRSGAIGAVTEAHVWTNRPGRYWRQGLDRPTSQPECPPHVNWDLWLGPAPERAYHPYYHPFAWRGWVDFGTGALGDMACHTANMMFMGLDLGYPTAVQAESAPCNGDSFPLWSIITYEFPARGDRPAMKVIWYDGEKDGKRNLPPEGLLPGVKMSDSGTLIVGSKGMLFAPNDYGAGFKLLPEEDFADYQPPAPKLPRVGGAHHQEFINAIKNGGQPLASFDYAGKLTEFVLVGNLAVLTGQKIDWDGETMTARNCPEA
ncbi:MAG TPA: Gfo/Idh/MocA family oxidoreductase, partial [Gemmatales bacterium]|nr:Gfo/Idh/MocA family oxidoreductase [Gemmatales bacterium]